MPSAIDLLIDPRPRDLGDFEVRRVLPFARRRSVGPFIFFDHFGPVTFAPGKGIDVRPHPHVCLATVTYLFEGEIVHRDSLGYDQPIRPGDVNWMTAGRGIVHSERTGPEIRANGHDLHGIQSWVALPKEHEETDPAFVHHPGDTLPSDERDGVALRVIAGTGFGLESPVAVLMPTFYVDLKMSPASKIVLADEHEERAIYVATGSVTLDGETVEAGRMAVLTPGAAPDVESADGPGHGLGRRRVGRRTASLVEFRRQRSGANRKGQSGLEGRPVRYGRGRRRVHSAARKLSE